MGDADAYNYDLEDQWERIGPPTDYSRPLPLGEVVSLPTICPWCRDGSHTECIEDADPYGPDCECDHAE